MPKWMWLRAYKAAAALVRRVEPLPAGQARQASLGPSVCGLISLPWKQPGKSQQLGFRVACCCGAACLHPVSSAGQKPPVNAPGLQFVFVSLARDRPAGTAFQGNFQGSANCLSHGTWSQPNSGNPDRRQNEPISWKTLNGTCISFQVATIAVIRRP
ncbi:hypothetical protein N658DRAFT_356642 [Parathielavia hyrcaniae]|uniref:Uncharacterized protein n=1 Tax=Parathielavia hyrcaniae TaxID=113614 RepID=A0AAN6Q767_9PEZI|nr:hypothetical protein N658DRAFT_356642 [Parathielavia hyrcaniae]